MRPDAPVPPEEDAGPAPDLPGDAPAPAAPSSSAGDAQAFPSPGGEGDDPPGPRRGGRRRRRGRRGRSGPESEADGSRPGLAPEADAFEPPPGEEPPGAPTLLEPGTLPAEAAFVGDRPPGAEEEAAAGRRPGGAGAEPEGRRGRRRGGRRRRGREGAAPAGADLLREEAGADLPAPDPAAAPPPEGAPNSGEGREDREERRRRRREREDARRERGGRRAERGSRRPREEGDLPEVHEAPLPALEEGEEPSPHELRAAAVVKTLLINATDPEEVRIALLEDGQLEEIYLETGHERSAAGNVYRGRVQNVERGIGAAFVDLGRGLMGFLHVSDLPERPEGKEDAPVTELLEPGQEVLVQITRDSIGRKGPALTGRISLPGRYLVLMPNSDRSGVSRRIGQGRERDRMRRLMQDLEVPEGMGLIVRTAGESQPLELLKADLRHLLAEWEALKVKAAEAGLPGLLRGESDVAERCVRDLMPADASRVIVDDPAMAERIRSLLTLWYPERAPAEPSPPAAAPPAAAPPVVPPQLPALPAAVQPTPGAGAAASAPPASAEPPDDFAAGLLLPTDGSAARATEPAAGPASGPPAPEPDVDAPLEEAGPSEDPLPAPAPAPAALPRPPVVEPWTDPMPLLHAHGVETQLEDALRRLIRLPSGGSIVVDPTEALVAIDVNSGRLTDEEDPERTALVTNLEAVSEVTRQLRLRDLGGLIVIDFIDMRDRKAVRKVERALRAALVRDRARIRVDRIGPFGCVMLSRQRIRQALARVTHEECAACAGTGRRRLLSGLALRVLREMQARVARSRGRGGLEVRAPLAVVEWLKKHRSTALRDLRQVCTGPVRLEADVRLAADGWAMRGLPPEGPQAPARSVLPPGGAIKP